MSPAVTLMLEEILESVDATALDSLDSTSSALGTALEVILCDYVSRTELIHS